MHKANPNPKNKTTAKKKIKKLKKPKITEIENSKSSQAEILSDDYQLDYHIKYLTHPEDDSLLTDSDMLFSTTSDKSTACYFKEFGDFWPYLGKMKLPELIKNKRFCFILNNPQYLRKENRIYLVNLSNESHIVPPKRKVIEERKPIDEKENIKKAIDEIEINFKKAEEMMKKDFPNYFQYLKSYYTKKKMGSLGNKDNKEFKEVILNSSKQTKDYLLEMEHLFRLYNSNFV